MKSLSPKYGCLLLLLILFSYCSRNELYSEFYSFEGSSWDKDHIVYFKVPVTDTLSRYDVQVEIRNKNNYSFQNLWLFVDFKTPDGKVRRDTMNCELADMYGKWYGKGVSLYTLSLPFEQSVQYPDSGTYTYSIRQGMRENPLAGISDIGLKISKKAD